MSDISREIREVYTNLLLRNVPLAAPRVKLIALSSGARAARYNCIIERAGYRISRAKFGTVERLFGYVYARVL